MPGTDIGIDLGTANILIYVESKGIVLNEPSIVAVDDYTGEIVAWGSEASKMLGRTSSRINVINPVENGVVSDYQIAEQLIIMAIKQVAENMMFMPRVVVCIPGKITEVESRAISNAVHAAGARKICLIEEPIAAAMGCGLDIFKPHGNLIIDIGAGTTDMAVITLGGNSVSQSINIAGNKFDEAIVKYIKLKYNMLIGKKMAESAKIAIANLFPTEDTKYYTIKGRNLLTGLPQKIEISSDEIMEAILPLAMIIVKEVQNLLEITPPDLMSDIYQDGAVLTGGGALIKGLDQLISKKAKIKVKVADDALNCVAKGTGLSLKFIDSVDSANVLSLNPLIEG